MSALYSHLVTNICDILKFSIIGISEEKLIDFIIIMDIMRFCVLYVYNNNAMDKNVTLLFWLMEVLFFDKSKVTFISQVSRMATEIQVVFRLVTWSTLIWI